MSINKKCFLLAMSILAMCMQNFSFDGFVCNISDEELQYEFWWFNGNGKKAFEIACDGDTEQSRVGFDVRLYGEGTRKAVLIPSSCILNSGWMPRSERPSVQKNLSREQKTESIFLPISYLEWLNRIQNSEYERVSANYATLASMYKLTPQELSMRPMLPVGQPDTNLFWDLNNLMLMSDVNEPTREVSLQDVRYGLQLALLYKRTASWQQAIIDRFEQEARQAEKITFIERFGEGPDRKAMRHWANEVFNTALSD